MIYPVNYIGITQGFRKGVHNGVDFGWNSKHGGPNVPIYSVADGVVISIQNQTTGGKVLIIRHDNGFCSEYAHLSRIIVRVNDRVRKGEQVANMGSTGQVTGPHLHFGLYRGTYINYSINNFVNPLDYLYKEPYQIVSENTLRNYRILDASERPSERPEDEYSLGDYKTLTEMYIRKGPGINYEIKRVREITANGKKHVVNKDNNAKAVYKRNTIFTALEIDRNGETIWGRSPSGWICIKGVEVYCEKI